MRSSRAGASTWMRTSSGIRFSSIKDRTKSKSVCEADGKATSISLKPIATSRSNIRRLRAWSMGSISAWLPSRRSELHQSGARVMVLFGHLRSGSDTGVVARYFFSGWEIMTATSRG